MVSTMEALRVQRDGTVLRITLARPDRRNAFDAALIAELTEAFADVGDTRAVVLSGDGPSFCAGADVEWQRSSIDLSYDENVEDAMRLFRMLEAIDACPAPVVCVVQGYALGGGSGLVACADIAVAHPEAVFGFTEVRLGIIPAVISPCMLPRVGAAARATTLRGSAWRRHRTADRARARGRRGHRGDGVWPRGGAALGGPGGCARGETPRAGATRWGRGRSRVAAERRTSDEGQSGLHAFLDKRPPIWREQ